LFSQVSTVNCKYWTKYSHVTDPHKLVYEVYGQLRPKTVWTQHISVPSEVRPVLQCLDMSAPVLKCPGDSSALVPKCLNFHQTFFCYATIEQCNFATNDYVRLYRRKV